MRFANGLPSWLLYQTLLLGNRVLGRDWTRLGAARADQRVIFDLGMNRGEDTEFYLSKGFRVIAVEANPLLAEAAGRKFAREIESGRLIVLNLGVGREHAELPFYANQANDHWSSFNAASGQRGGTKADVIQVRTAPIRHFVEQFGTPYYMKIDIEGYDGIVLEQLAQLEQRPQFISFEIGPVEYLDLARAAGYQRFQVLAQNDKSWAVPPFPPREGAYVARRFSGQDSGLFGEELPLEWLSFDEARARVAAIRERKAKEGDQMSSWHDVHARR